MLPTFFAPLPIDDELDALLEDLDAEAFDEL
jgi:hypothetical protein